MCVCACVLCNQSSGTKIIIFACMHFLFFSYFLRRSIRNESIFIFYYYSSVWASTTEEKYYDMMKWEKL